ncbi:uncharacterized protein LOC113278214 [Papaver somniferum]|uniref:uncharacterized protein LOC113278214 n=1 Tax=Papaver somniferum TaxID=3469 RepID=UPI000E6F6A8D|nr:uncharacterized protein LOC113278214 [Papaver somniferum]
MRILARQLTTYLSRGRGYPQNKLITTRRFSSFAPKDEIALEAEVERKVGWMLKAFYVASATFVGYQFFPYMGDNLLHQSISLMHVKDPLFKRMGASRISRFAVDDERRMRVVEMGGDKDLVEMLKFAKDDKTRKSALKALSALSNSDEAAGALHQAGAISVIKSTPVSLEDAALNTYKIKLLQRFQDLKYDEVQPDLS